MSKKLSKVGKKAPTLDQEKDAIAAEKTAETIAIADVPAFEWTDVRHPDRFCRWCGEHFMPIYKGQWICPTPSCHVRQFEWAIKHPGGGKYSYIPTPAGVELHSARYPNLLWGGAAGAAKSHGLRWNKYLWAGRIPDLACLLMRRTFPELESTHLEVMDREAEMLGPQWRYSRGERMMRNDENGSFVRAGHCDSPKDYQRLLSTEYGIITFDEGTTFLEQQLTEISARARTGNELAHELMGGAHVRIGSNPDGPGAAYIKSAYIDKDLDPEDYEDYDPAMYHFIAAFLHDNPYADKNYEAKLRQLKKDRVRQLLKGDWSVVIGQFFQLTEANIVRGKAA